VELASDGPIYIAQTCSVGVRKVVVTANIEVLETGAGGVDVLAITSDAEGSTGLYLTRIAGGAGFQIEANGNLAHGLRHTFAKFTQVVLEMDIEHQTYSYAVGNGGADPIEEGRDEPIVNAFKPPNAYVLAGASYTNGVDGTWHIRVDDIDVTTGP
jgi:hypothetical protein